MRIEGGGAAGASIGPKFIQWVQLQDTSTRAVFIAASHHLVPTHRDQGPPEPAGTETGRLRQKSDRRGWRARDPAQPWRADPVPDRRGLERRRPQGRPSPHRRLPVRGVAEVRAVLQLAGARLPERGHADPRHPADRRHLLHHPHRRAGPAADPRPLRQRPPCRPGPVHQPCPSSSATLTTDTAAQVGAVPAKITVPSSRTGRDDGREGEQIATPRRSSPRAGKPAFPTFGWVVAIATALQESGLRNLDLRRP